MSTLLAYVETCLPGTSAAERLWLARAEGLALELADDGALDPEPYRGTPIAALQVFRLHEDPPLHRDRWRRQEAAKHVAATLELAARMGVPRAVVICAYGSDLADAPFERALEFLAAFERPARDVGVQLLIEPLSPLRTPVLNDPTDIARLVTELAAPAVFAPLLDTGHLLDGGFDPETILREWRHPLGELQLRGARSAPPPLEITLEKWLPALTALPPVISVEHRESIEEPAWRDLVRALRETLDSRA